jgi:hypothetical protein
MSLRQSASVRARSSSRFGAIGPEVVAVGRFHPGSVGAARVFSPEPAHEAGNAFAGRNGAALGA